jgi:hypothetical protein
MRMARMGTTTRRMRMMRSIMRMGMTMDLKRTIQKMTKRS